MPASWERQPDEGPQAFEAFVAYRDLGPQRSIRAVARSLDKSASLIGRWSSAHDWRARVGDWDAEQDRASQEGHRASAVERGRERARLLSRQIEALSGPAVELARRLECDDAALADIDTVQLLSLSARAARPLAALVEAERSFLRGEGEDERDAAARRVQRMSREQLEEYLIGLDDGYRGVT